ncbi:AmmeMemoRadiSam system protein B [Iodidimonas sp. SYSU 1G8]|uniref:AmmeMemoRadiSam system protein B n=1 Tax=Iodidimonas sp. SYSU 1G8 TaxID=3133967 RepID=UPI0031FE4788
MSVDASLVKQPGVAGMFYPADRAACAAQVNACLNAALPASVAAKVLVVPHAGYIYSGTVAATAYATLRARRAVITRVVLLGPNHRVGFRGIALSTARSWATPLGEIPVDMETMARLRALPDSVVADAPFAQEHSLEVHLPFLQTVLGQFTLVPVLVGDAAPQTVARVLSECWGGPETLIVISSDLSHFHDYDTAGTLDGDAARAIEMLRPDLLRDEQACGNRPLRGLLLEAQRRDLRATTLDLRNSGDTAGNRDRVVGYGSFAFEYAESARLAEPHRRLLLDAAVTAIRYGIQHGKMPAITLKNMPRALLAMRATFVTLTLDGQLRGCIGSVTPHRSLVLDVMENAYKAAFADPRFKPLTATELERLDVEVSILSQQRPIPFDGEQALLNALRPDRDGLVIADGDRRALFLPKVWQTLPHARDFLSQLKRKAGLAADHWSDGFRANRFSTETFSRSFTMSGRA